MTLTHATVIRPNKATERPGDMAAYEAAMQTLREKAEREDPRSKVPVFTVLVDASGNSGYTYYKTYYTDSWQVAHNYACRTGQKVGISSLYRAEENEWSFMWPHQDLYLEILKHPIVQETFLRMW